MRIISCSGRSHIRLFLPKENRSFRLHVQKYFNVCCFFSLHIYHRLCPLLPSSSSFCLWILNNGISFVRLTLDTCAERRWRRCTVVGLQDGAAIKTAVFDIDEIKMDYWYFQKMYVSTKRQYGNFLSNYIKVFYDSEAHDFFFHFEKRAPPWDTLYLKQIGQGIRYSTERRM